MVGKVASPEVISSPETIAQRSSAIGALFREVHTPNPYFSPEWVSTWLKTLGSQRQLMALYCGNAQHCDAFWPFFTVPGLGRKGLWPVGAHSADLFTPLYRNPTELPALVEGINQLLKRHAFLWTPLLPEAFAYTELLPLLRERGIRHLIRPRAQNWLIDATTLKTAEAWLAHAFSQKAQRDLDRRERRLREEGALDFRVTTDADEIATLFPLLVAVERKSWKGSKGEGLFHRSEIRRFYESALPALARQGLLRLALCEHKNRLVAYQLEITEGRSCYVHTLAYREEYANRSPGLLLIRWEIMQLFQLGFERIDFLQGKQAYKERICNVRQTLWDLTVFSRSISGRLHEGLLRLRQ